MAESRARQVIVAGAGIAGLTAALAFAARGYAVRIFERAGQIEEIGAGIQLSPNATRILDRLGVLALVRPAAVRPEAVVLRDARSLAELARVPLGDAAERRWKAPYLAVHRADLQSALLARVAQTPDIELTTGATVRDMALHAQGVTVSVDIAGGHREVAGFLLVAADGVWSAIRQLTGKAGQSLFVGRLAWRATIRAESAAGEAFAAVGGRDVVTALLHPGFHMIAYPVRGGAAINLVAFTPGREIAESWSQNPDQSILTRAMAATAPALQKLAAQAGPWTAWPIHVADLDGPWTAPEGLALIGDAAHAMTPFAAQGAAMAIEDAEVLAGAVAGSPSDVGAALAAWSKARRQRILKVARRGALNQFAWHAGGPVALARNIFLRSRAPEKLAADLDWLYGWEPPVPPA